MPPRKTAPRSSRSPRTSPRRRSTSTGTRSRTKTHSNRLGPLFYTVVAVTGLCALAFMGLMASALAGGV